MERLTCKYMTQVIGACLLIGVAAAGSAHLQAQAAGPRDGADGHERGRVPFRDGAAIAGEGENTYTSTHVRGWRAEGARPDLPTNTPTATRIPARVPTPCPTHIFEGSIEPGDQVQNGRLIFDNAGVCDIPARCLGQADTAPRRFDAYTFANPSSKPVCVSVTFFTGECLPGQVSLGNRFMDSASYLGTFDAGGVDLGGLCNNYLADAGAAQGPTLSYGFTVPPFALFTVVLNEAIPGLGCARYNLAVDGCVTLVVSPTPTPTPDPSARLLVGHVKWQGLPDQPHPLQQQPVSLTLRSDQTVVEYPIQLTSPWGNFTVTTYLPDGLYEWRAKGAHFLANAGTLKLRGGPVIQQEMGEMRTGDLHSDNVVNVFDFALFRLNYGKGGGDAGHERDAGGP